MAILAGLVGRSWTRWSPRPHWDERWPEAVETARAALADRSTSFLLDQIAAVFVLVIAKSTGVRPAEVTAAQLHACLVDLEAGLHQQAQPGREGPGHTCPVEE